MKGTGVLTRNDFIKIFLAALIIRGAHIIFLVAIGVGVTAPDSGLYLDRADWFFRTGAFLFGPAGAPVPDYERVYGYTLVLAGLKSVFGSILLPAVIFQSLVDSVTVCLIGAVASRIGRRVGLLAAILTILWPNMVLHSTLLLSDSLALAASVGGIFFFVRTLERRSVKQAVWMSVCFGVSLAIRPAALPLVPVISVILCGYFFWYGTLRSPFLAVVVGFLPLVFAALFLMPQVLRIEQNFGTYRITAQQGTHLLNWVTAEIYAESRGGTRGQWASEFEQEAIHRAADIPNTAAFKQSDIRVALAWEKLSEIAPLDIAVTWGRAAAMNLILPSLMVHPVVQNLKSESFSNSSGTGIIDRVTSFVQRQSSGYVAITIISLTIVAIGSLFAVWGLILSGRQYPKMTLLGLGYCAYYLVLTGPVLGAKYALPFDPVLIVWTALGILGGLDRFRMLREVRV
ncbi:MAG: hypothetical protein CMM78_06895 [Rhodospirillaceae bacterium]|jgi:hypothetical protein|uniref:glycosyltransferase family 39 protein n=1 Tax=Hwanghaeella sp. 1Z406 TaxID=3402811 RepID=UPI000C655A21|nr:hypothetical protein [Rhodospirillaceae bacterium]|tara:strand:+ start:628 stop:1998 length:1371 start_codon:yes stop_codon:yes gene_type:complete